MPSCSGYIHLPDDSRTKLGRRLRKKAAISKGTESLRALPASSHPVARTLAAFPGIAKPFFASASRLIQRPKDQNPIVSAKIAHRADQIDSRPPSNISGHILSLRVADLDRDPAVGFEKSLPPRRQ